MYYSAIACLSIFFNVWLYFDDIHNREGILDSIVNNSENLHKLMAADKTEDSGEM